MVPLPVGTSGKSAVQVAREAALKAGEILVSRFDSVRKVSFKGRGNIVTDVDEAAEKKILSMLKAEFPGTSILAEESGGPRGDAGWAWIVDPLDGTRNYASGIPFFSTVIGLALDGEVTVGVNYDPMRDEMFEATRGQGAYLNGRPLEVSKKSRIGDCVLGMDLSYNDQGVINGIDVIRSIWPDMQTLRIMGSSALGIAYAASGRTDLYFHHQLEPWDQVAGILLVEEAGGIITDRAGKRAGLYSDGLIASNHTLHAEFMRKTEGLAWSQRNRLPPHATADDPPE